MIENALDASLSDEERARIVQTAIETRDSCYIDILVQLAEDKSAYMRSCAAQGLGKIAARECFEHLCDLMKDLEKLVRQDAVLALGDSRDSRALFALVNYFNNTSQDLKRHVVTAVCLLNDPRSKDWLDIMKNYDDPVIVDIAGNEHVPLRAPFLYTFAGHEQTRKLAEADEKPSKIIYSQRDLEDILPILKEFERMNRPQTFVVDKNGQLRIGGFVQEHVDVAAGQDVLTAGEVRFVKINGNWRVAYFNNRSNGYFPAKTSHLFFVQAAKSAGLDCPSEFSETFPKEGYFSDLFLRDKPFYSIKPSE